MKKKQWRLDTTSIHAGEPRPPFMGSVSLPIFQSSTFEFFGPDEELRYIRLNNTPNHKALSKKLASLEKAERAVLFASGMAAISTVLLALTKAGDRILSQEILYGGTYQFFRDFAPHLGREIDYFRLEDLGELNRKLTPNTRILYVEALSNPLLDVPDLEAVCAFAKNHGLYTVIDNTFPSPVNLNPLNLGFDVAVHSATKYLNGHTDIVAGCAVGPASLINPVEKLAKTFGATLDPHSCFLLSRGIKTLGVRVRQQNASALALARELQKHPKVKRVLYPGLESHPNHTKAKMWFEGFGGMFSFELHGSVDEADAFCQRLKIPYVAPSLGGVETLVTRPALTSHHYLSAEDRQKAGVTDTLIRVSVGLEDLEDLKDDFLSALG